MVVEINGQAGRAKLALRCDDTVACAVCEKGDGLAVLCSSKSSLKGLVLDIANLCNIIARDKFLGFSAVSLPLIVSRGILLNSSLLADNCLVGCSSHCGFCRIVKNNLSIESRLKHQAEAIIGIIGRCENLDVAVDYALTRDSNVY